MTSKPTGQKILVTGGTGFLGSHLVTGLARGARGAAKDVRVLVQSAPPAWLTELGVEICKGSIVGAADVARAVEGVDRVYHLAGMVSHKPVDGHKMFSVHVEGTRTLCDAAVKAGVRRIVMSSTSGTIAASKHAGGLADETSATPMDVIARWPYYTSKVYQEETAKRLCAGSVELVTVNPSLLLGPGDNRLSSTRPVLQFLSREVLMTPPGGLNFVDARDVAAILPVAMDRGRPGERYLIGGYNWTFEELFGRLERLSKVPAPRLKARGPLPLLATRAQAALFRHWGRRPPVEPQSVEMAEHFWYFDSGKAARELGFEPRDATDTLFATIKYIREHLLGNDAFSKEPTAPARAGA